MPEKISLRKRLAARLRGASDEDPPSRQGVSDLPAPLHPALHGGTRNVEGKAVPTHADEIRDITGETASSTAPHVAAVSSVRTIPQTANTSQITSGKDEQDTASTSALQSFWARGYLKKKATKPDLILAYEALIADEIAGDRKPIPAPATVVAAVRYDGSGSVRLAPAKYGTGEYYIPEPDQMCAFVAKQTASIQDLRWKIPFSEQGIDVQRQTKNIVRAILYAKDAITQIATLEPHASIAWAGVCLVLPLLVNPEVQKEQLTKGLEQVTSILCRLVVSERLYREEYCNTNYTVVNEDILVMVQRFEEESVGLLADIIEYQARVACHTSRGPLSKYLSDVVKRDNWSALTSQIVDADRSCARLLGTLNEQKYDRNQHYLKQRLEKLDIEAARITALQQDILNEVQQFSKRMADGMSETEAREILEALATSNYERHKRVIPRRVPGTCQWFTSHPQYLSWKETVSSAALWLVADPGCGKSVLSKYLVDEELLDDSRRTVCYFFFKVGIEEQQGLERVLCALLHQLFAKKNGLMRAAFKPFRTLGKAFAQSADQLWNILVSAASDRDAGECIFVLDGLDECDPEDRRELIRKVSSYYLSNETSKTARAKFLMTSRPYRTINESFQNLIEQLPRVHLSADQETAAIRKEIDVVVDHRVYQLAESLSLNQTTAHALACKLKAAENRTYLWLRLIFEVIEESRASSKRELDRWVDTVPSTVQEAYAAILKRCENPSKARTIFELVLAAQSALTVQELNIALACTDVPGASDVDNDDDQRLDMDSHDVFHDKIRHICGLFVSIIDDRVYFIHKTAREFLTDEALKEHMHMAIELPLSVTRCHLTLAKSCTKYLLRNARCGLHRSEIDWLRYASCSWEAHVAIGCLSDGGDSFEDLYEASLAVCQNRATWWPFRTLNAVETASNPAIATEEDHTRGEARTGFDEKPNTQAGAAYQVSESHFSDVAGHESTVEPSNTSNDQDAEHSNAFASPADLATASVDTIKKQSSKLTDPNGKADATVTSWAQFFHDADSNGQQPDNFIASQDPQIVSDDSYDTDSDTRAEITTLSLFGLVAMTWLAGTRVESKQKRRIPQSLPGQVIMQWIILYHPNAPAKLSLWLGDQSHAHDIDTLKPDSAYKVFWEPNYLKNNTFDSRDSASDWNNNQDLLRIAESICGSSMSILEARPFYPGSEVEYSLDVDSSLNTLAAAFQRIASHARESKKNIETYSQLLQRANELGLLRELIFRPKQF